MTPPLVATPGKQEAQFTPSGELVSASLEKTIEYAVQSSFFRWPEQRTEALVALAQCFRTYCTAEHLLELTMAQYARTAGDAAAQRNAIELLQRWVECGFNTDLLHNAPLLDRLQAFVVAQTQSTAPGVGQAAQKVHQLAMLLSKQATTVLGASVPLQPGACADAALPKQASLLAFGATDVAQQLALIQYDIMMGITVPELLRDAWKQADAAQRAPGIARHLEFEHSRILWLKEQVVSCKRDSDRKKLLERFVVLAEKCLAINNFSGFVIFYRALSYPGFVRHTRLYTKKATKRLDTFGKLMLDDCKELRAMQEERCDHCLPFLEPWLNDIAAAEHSQPDFADGCGDQINWAKVKQLGAALRCPQAFLRSTGYSFAPKPPVLAFIHMMKPTMTEDEISARASSLTTKS